MIENILVSLLTFSGPIQIAVVDTGYTYSNIFNASLCKTGHKDFTNDQKYENGVPIDDIGHGSNVAGSIHQYAINITLNESLINKDKIKKLKQINPNYCLVIIKAFAKNSDTKAYNNALEYVKNLNNVSIVNISAGGNSFDLQEYRSIKQMLDDKKTIIAAAGNNGESIDLNPYYPASDDPRIIVVGNSFSSKVQETKNKVFSKKYSNIFFGATNSSNYGSEVDVFVNGISKLSLSSKKDELSSLTGTSQSTAVFTGMIINSFLKKSLINEQARRK